MKRHRLILAVLLMSGHVLTATAQEVSGFKERDTSRLYPLNTTFRADRYDTHTYNGLHGTPRRPGWPVRTSPGFTDRSPPLRTRAPGAPLAGGCAVTTAGTHMDRSQAMVQCRIPRVAPPLVR